MPVMITIAVLGAAHPHVTHLATLAGKIDGAKLVGLYDDDPQRRKTWSEALKMPPFDDLSALLAQKPNLVLVGAVPSDRAGLAERALAAGCNVLIDKPLALDRMSLERVKAAQRKSGHPAIVFYPVRGLPLVAAAKQAVQSGRIGRIVRILASGPHWLRSMHPRPDWHWKRSTNGDILLDIGSHYFDLCCWLTGSAPIDIASRMGNYNVPEHPEFRDFGFSHMRFPGGELAYIDVDWLVVPRAETAADTHIWIQGTNGKIDLFFGKQTIGQIWTEGYFEPLAPAEKSLDDWTIDLMRDIAQGKPCAISQEDVWRASEVSLAASAAARAEEQ